MDINSDIVPSANVVETTCFTLKQSSNDSASTEVKAPNAQNRYSRGNISASGVGKLVGIDSGDLTFLCIKDKVQRSQAQVKANFEVLKDHTKNDFKGNYYTRRGQFYEWLPLRLIEIIFQVVLMPSPSYQSEDALYCFGTPDSEFGWNGETCNAEVKVNSKVATKIPPAHMAQMQTQMNCSKRKKTIYVSVSLAQNRAMMWEVPYSEDYWRWLFFQLEYLHEEAMKDTPAEDLDMDNFNFEPPEVDARLLHNVKNVRALIQDIPEFPEKNPLADKPRLVKRKREPDEICSDVSKCLKYKEGEEHCFCLKPLPLKCCGCKRSRKEIREQKIRVDVPQRISLDLSFCSID